GRVGRLRLPPGRCWPVEPPGRCPPPAPPVCGALLPRFSPRQGAVAAPSSSPATGAPGLRHWPPCGPPWVPRRVRNCGLFRAAESPNPNALRPWAHPGRTEPGDPSSGRLAIMRSRLTVCALLVASVVLGAAGRGLFADDEKVAPRGAAAVSIPGVPAGK